LPISFPSQWKEPLQISELTTEKMLILVGNRLPKEWKGKAEVSNSGVVQIKWLESLYAYLKKQPNQFQHLVNFAYPILLSESEDKLYNYQEIKRLFVPSTQGQLSKLLKRIGAPFLHSIVADKLYSYWGGTGAASVNINSFLDYCKVIFNLLNNTCFSGLGSP
jgi:hypothetical protein